MAIAKICVTCGNTVPSGERTYNEMCKACAVHEAKKASASIANKTPSLPTPMAPKPIFPSSSPNEKKGEDSYTKEDGWSLIRRGIYLQIAGVLLGGVIQFFGIVYYNPIAGTFLGGALLAYCCFISSVLIFAGVIRIAIYPLVENSEKANVLLGKLLADKSSS